MRKYMTPEIRISKFNSEIITTVEEPTDSPSPLSEASFTTGAQQAFTSITGTASKMQKSVNFQDAMKYK